VLGSKAASGSAVTPKAVHEKLDSEIKLWGPLITKAGVASN
jgi:hypothetical protein